MQRAATACHELIRRRWPQARRIGILCGRGNNGGDGYELARLLRADSREVELYAVGDLPETGDAAAAAADWRSEGGVLQRFAGALPVADLWVDALLGIGLNRAPDGAVRAAIEAVNRQATSGTPVLAVDVPSGLNASTGHVPGVAVRASVTLTFIAGKLGLRTGAGVDHAGYIEQEDLGIPATLLAGTPPRVRCLAPEDLEPARRPRARNAHKGHSGHVLLVGGNQGMAGAILLAGRAALRAGAGLVTIATRPAHAVALAAAQPELMAHGVADAAALAPLLARADVVAIGPGLGEDAWARELWAAVIACDKPRVLDADALNLLARVPRRIDEAILTPHPGEAARLLALANAAEVQRDRLQSLRQLEARYGAVVVLKGAGSLVSDETPWLCPHGNPGMAVGGSGDVLTGVVAALRAQGASATDAARWGVLAHALAGDRAALAGERGLLPSDLIDALRVVLNP